MEEAITSIADATGLTPSEASVTVPPFLSVTNPTTIAMESQVSFSTTTLTNVAIDNSMEVDIDSPWCLVANPTGLLPLPPLPSVPSPMTVKDQLNQTLNEEDLLHRPTETYGTCIKIIKFYNKHLAGDEEKFEKESAIHIIRKLIQYFRTPKGLELHTNTKKTYLQQVSSYFNTIRKDKQMDKETRRIMLNYMNHYESQSKKQRQRGEGNPHKPMSDRDVLHVINCILEEAENGMFFICFYIVCIS